MFTGIDDVDWASMNHAYGDASDVPELLRGLASADPDEREAALDGMHGAVHHQGDVYDSTVACIPFLFELVATAGLPGRGGIVDLLRSIDGDGRDVEEMDFGCDDEEEYDAWVRNLAGAESATRARSGLLLDLLDDPDAGLRQELPGALVQLHDDPATVLAALCRRLATEQDARVLRATATALGELGVRSPEFARRVEEALTALALPAPGRTEPGLRLAALVQLARCAPGRLPERTVKTAVDAMREAREDTETREGPEDAGDTADTAGAETGSAFGTPTMISYLRRLRASHRGTVRASWATDLLVELHYALDDRVAERFALLEDQLRSPDWGQRREAIDMGGLLLTGWRGPHEESVRLLGEQLREGDPRIGRWAAKELERLYAIGGPATGALAERVAAGPGTVPQARWNETSYGAALCALAAQGDARAVPGLVEVLRFGHVPEDLGGWIDRMGPDGAAALLPVLLRRLSAIDPRERPGRTRFLLEAVAAAGPDEVVEPVLRLLRVPGLRGAAVQALARLGATAREALPELRRLAREKDPGHRVDVAAALWAAGGEQDLVLSVLAEGLAGERWFQRYDALRTIARMGPGAAGLLPALRGLRRSPEKSGGWVAGALAVALWQVGRDPDESVPALLHAWSEHRDNRPEAAEAWARMGSAAAPAVPLLRRELASARRHDNTGGRGRNRYRCAEDERLLRHGRAVIAAVGS
ncbi:HEAT repeat domain-containing protein [Streptomyces sp. NPDC087218]|uniref:HEAT repeat domain-containing protein n=1 Tax=Streptomyces sp. NPDC087218 TaxID=3365769 RepID=UPI0037F5B73F